MLRASAVPCSTLYFTEIHYPYDKNATAIPLATIGGWRRSYYIAGCSFDRGSLDHVLLNTIDPRGFVASLGLLDTIM